MKRSTSIWCICGRLRLREPDFEGALAIVDSNFEDGYIRLTPQRHRKVWLSAPPSASHPILFIDIEVDRVDFDEILDAFKDIPHRTSNFACLLIRWPEVEAIADPSTESLRDGRARDLLEKLAALGRGHGQGAVPVGAARFRIGAYPSIIWAHDNWPPIDVDRILGRARAAEFRTLLEWGHAIWRPKDYHYILPSGKHSSTFIRVADSFRSPRDAEVIASWTFDRLRDGTAMVADSSTLVPLVLQIQALMYKVGWTPGPVALLDEQARTRVDVHRAIRGLARARGGILALLSVNATGVSRDLMYEAMLNASGNADIGWSLIVLLDKNLEYADSKYLPLGETLGVDRIGTWLGVAERDLNPLDEPDCVYCRSNERSQTIAIDPRSFEAIALPGEELVMPHVGAANEMRRLLDVCDSAGALGILVRAIDNERTKYSRPKAQEMSVRIDFATLLSSETLVTEATQRIRELRREKRGRPVQNELPDYGRVEAVVVNSEEARLPGFDQLVDVIMHELLGKTVPKIGVDQARQYTGILVFELGAVTGWSLRQRVLEIEEQWTDADRRTVFGLVLHARPSTIREWSNWHNSYSRQLGALWLTFIPWESPFTEEIDLLSGVNPDDEDLPLADEYALDYYEERMAFCTARAASWQERLAVHAQQVAEGQLNDPDPYSIFWGMGSRRKGFERVRNYSLYGYQVRALTLFVGMGAAMNFQRQVGDRHDPRWRMFDFPSIVRSYYDGIIVASALRWAQPSEAWWGRNVREQEAVVRELINRTRMIGDQAVLYPELLLAAAQGKLPRAAAVTALTEIEAETRDWEDLDRAPVSLAAWIVRQSVLAT